MRRYSSFIQLMESGLYAGFDGSSRKWQYDALRIDCYWNALAEVNAEVVALTKKTHVDKDTAFSVAIENALSALGDPVKKTIVWHMHNKGIYIGTKDFDLRMFYLVLEEFIGSAADVVVKLIHTDLQRQLIQNDILKHFAPDPRNDHPLSKIEKLMKSEDNDD